MDHAYKKQGNFDGAEWIICKQWNRKEFIDLRPQHILQGKFTLRENRVEKTVQILSNFHSCLSKITLIGKGKNGRTNL